jgi:hypothetical protein
MTYLAQRRGARIVECPIVFPDRQRGVSKMSKRIVLEALAVVVQLRLAEWRHHGLRGAADTEQTADLGA